MENSNIIKCNCGREYEESYCSPLCPLCDKINQEAQDDLINECNALFEEIDRECEEFERLKSEY